jgi:hypothetical protein
MKLARIRLGTVLKVFILLHLAVAMVWLNSEWVDIDTIPVLTEQDRRVLYDESFTIESDRWEPTRIRGWPRSYQGGAERLIDTRALLGNIAACALIMFCALLVLIAAPRWARLLLSLGTGEEKKVASD